MLGFADIRLIRMLLVFRQKIWFWRREDKLPKRFFHDYIRHRIPCKPSRRTSEAVVEFSPPLQAGTLIRRYKRFLADIETSAGVRTTIHCANTGAMLGCADPGSAIWYSTADNPKRKYPHSLEIVRDATGALIVVNTSRANALVAEAIADGLLPDVPRRAAVTREVAIPDADGRFDLHVAGIYIEVKSVTLRVVDCGAFPDAVSRRATRHATELGRLARSGKRTALVFCVLHSGIDAVRPADEIDPAYGAALRAAAADGVRLYAVRCAISTQGIKPLGLLPIILENAS